jgi:hypothetical protein
VKVTDLSKALFFEFEFVKVVRFALFPLVVKLEEDCFERRFNVLSELFRFSEVFSLLLLLLFKLELLIFLRIFDSAWLKILSKS